MSEQHPNDPGHGDSVAAWTAVIVITLAVAGGTLAFWFGDMNLVYASAGMVAVGLIAGVVLSKLGFGVKRNSARRTLRRRPRGCRKPQTGAPG